MTTLALIALVAGGLYLRSRRAAPLAKAAPLTEKDSVLLADFVNKTGDTAFDHALKQALTIQLSQSPFLNIVSDRKIEETLRLMSQPAAQHITPELAREVCLRTGSKATVLGSISNLGGQYVIGLNAISCSSGDTLASEQRQAAGKRDVLLGFFGVFRYSRRAIQLVWDTNRTLLLAMAVLTLAADPAILRQ